MPSYIGNFESRISIAAFLLSGEGLVAGVLEPCAQGAVLRDGTGALPIHKQALRDLELSGPAWFACRIQEGRYETLYFQPIQPSTEVAGLHEKHDLLHKRWDIHQAVRQFFLSRSFVEADTPLRVACPGMEPYLDAISASGAWLRTSPELHMKRLLAGGLGNLFQFAPSFRAHERGKLHREEFLMLEWYRAFADLNHIVEDVTALLVALAPLSTDRGYFESSPEMVTCAELFQRHLDLELRDHENREPLRQALGDRRIAFDPEDDWDTLFFLLFLNFIEPHLGRERPAIVTRYPASQAALAKLAPQIEGDMPTCYRFELYLRGMELANAFYELTDPEEQRQRFESDRVQRAHLGKPVYPIDEAFMAALESGLPPAAGIALGLDRLVLALLGKKDLAEVQPFG